MTPSAADRAGLAPQPRRSPARALLAFTADAFRACGLPDADATTVAAAMIEADLTGSDAHGIFRLAQYVRWLREGRINPRPQLELQQGAPAVAVVDGDNGLGHLAMALGAPAPS